MKNVRIVFVCLMVLFLSGEAFTQTAVKGKKGKKKSAERENSLLWKIEGKGIKTSYLYGTLHILPKSDFLLSDKTLDAFKSSGQVVMELDMDDPGMQMEIMKHVQMKDGVTLDQLLSEEDYKKLGQLLKESYGADIEFFKNWKPFMASALLMKNFVEGEMASYEATFVEHAKEQNLEVSGLETPEEQLQIFDEIPYATQAKDLSEMLNDEEKIKGMYKKMMQLYKNQDLAGLLTYMNDYYDDPKQLDLLLNNRNNNWIPKMKDFAEEKPTFFAVGAGHLAGDSGLIKLLRNEGYTLTPLN